MKIKFEEVTECKYVNDDSLTLFEDEVKSRAFGIISTVGAQYKFGWHSTIVKPVIDLIKEEYCSIGIDLKFVVFNINDGKVLLNLNLDFWFYESFVYNNYIYVVTELEIIKVNIQNFNIDKIYSLPDIFEEYKIEEYKIVVKCFNDDIVYIDITN